VKFKIDENTPIEAAEILCAARYDAATLGDQHMLGAPDQAIAEHVRSEGRVLLTIDLDFADIRAYPPQDYSGIIVLRPRRQLKPLILDMVRRLVPLLETQPVCGYLWIVGHHRVRIVAGGNR